MKQYIQFLIAFTLFVSIAGFSNGKDKFRGKKQALFNGHNFDGWRGINRSTLPEKGWKIEDGMIKCTGEKGGDLITTEEFENFELTWEWKMFNSGANSGIKYFVKELEGDKGGYGFGIEYQMLDDGFYIDRKQMLPNDYHTTGSAYELYPPSAQKKVKRSGVWNKSKIVSKNGITEHWLNGRKILEYNRLSDDFKQKVALSKFKNRKGFGVYQSGHILLQDHDSEIWFKNIKIKKYGSS